MIKDLNNLPLQNGAIYLVELGFNNQIKPINHQLKIVNLSTMMFPKHFVDLILRLNRYVSDQQAAKVINLVKRACNYKKATSRNSGLLSAWLCATNTVPTNWTLMSYFNGRFDHAFRGSTRTILSQIDNKKQLNHLVNLNFGHYVEWKTFNTAYSGNEYKRPIIF